METAIKAAIANYCRDHGYDQALEAFQKEANLLDFRRDDQLKITLEQKFFLAAKLQTALHILEQEQSTLLQQLGAFRALAYGEDADFNETEELADLAFSQHCSLADPDAVSLFEVSSMLPLYVISTIENVVMCKKLAGHQTLWSTKYEVSVSCIAFSPNGCSIAIGFEDGHIEYHENVVTAMRRGATRTYNIGEERCRSIRMSDARIIVLTAQSEFVVCSSVDGSILKHIPLTFNVSSWDLDAEDGLIVAGSDEGKLVAWDWTVGAESTVVGGEQEEKKIDFVKMISKGVIATAQREGQPRIWRLENGEHRVLMETLVYHSNWIIGIAACSAGILTMSDDGRIALWCSSSFKRIGEAKIAPCTKFRISFGATWLVSLSGTKLQLYQRPKRTRAQNTRTAARKIVNEQRLGNGVLLSSPEQETSFLIASEESLKPEAVCEVEKENLTEGGRGVNESLPSRIKSQASSLSLLRDSSTSTNFEPSRSTLPLLGELLTAENSPRQTTMSASNTASSDELNLAAKQSAGDIVLANPAAEMKSKNSTLNSSQVDSLSAISKHENVLKRAPLSSAGFNSITNISKRAVDSEGKLGRFNDSVNAAIMDDQIRGSRLSRALPRELAPEAENISRPLTARNTIAAPSTARSRLKPVPQSTTAVPATTPTQRMNIAQRLELEVRAAQAQRALEGKASPFKPLVGCGSEIRGKITRSSQLPGRGKSAGKSPMGASTDSTPQSSLTGDCGGAYAMTQRGHMTKKDSLLTVDASVNRLLQSSRRSGKVSKSQLDGEGKIAN